jgi:hypothetical protein
MVDGLSCPKTVPPAEVLAGLASDGATDELDAGSGTAERTVL